MKTIRVVVGVAVVLSAGAVAVWMWPTSRMGLCHVHHDKDIYGKDEVVKQIQNRVLPARPPIPGYYPTEAESNELVRVFVEITDAYTNAPLSVLREKFRNDGKAGLEALSDRFVREWCEQIESEKSFTRSYARFQVALQMSGGKTRAQANRFARSQTWGEGSSYKPKWLDEEFPVVPTPQN